MHTDALRFVARAVKEFGPFERTVEFGSLDINGSIRQLFTGKYLGIDIQPGRGVDVVADATEWRTDEPFDCVVAAEVFEHTPAWRDLIASASRALRPGGVLIVTCAGPGREPHSAFDGGAVREGEHYANVEPADLKEALNGFGDVYVEQSGTDVRAVARRASG